MAPAPATPEPVAAPVPDDDVPADVATDVQEPSEEPIEEPSEEPIEEQVEESPAEPRPVRLPVPTPSSDVPACIRGVPRSVVDFVLAWAGGGVRQTDAMVAFVVARSGRPVQDFPDLTDGQRELVGTLSADDGLLHVFDEVGQVRDELRRLRRDSFETEVLCAYLVAEMLGVRAQRPGVVTGLDLAHEDSVQDIIVRARDDAPEISRECSRQYGRLVRGGKRHES